MMRFAQTGLLGVLSCFPVPSLHAGELEVAPAPKRIYDPDEKPPGTFRGRVIGLSDDGITIKPEGSASTQWTRLLANGQKEAWIYRQDNTKPPMVFAFTANHKRIGVSSQGGQHKLADVQVGDIVKIDCYCYSGVMHCLGIEVHRRPGGKSRLPLATIASRRNTSTCVPSYCATRSSSRKKSRPRCYPCCSVAFLVECIIQVKRAT